MVETEILKGRRTKAEFQLRTSVDPLTAIHLSETLKRQHVERMVETILQDIPCSQEQRAAVIEITMLNFNQLLSTLQKVLEGENNPYRKISPASIRTIHSEWNRKVKDCVDPAIDLVRGFTPPVSAPKNNVIVLDLSLRRFSANIFRDFKGTDLLRFYMLTEEKQSEVISNLTEDIFEGSKMAGESVQAFRETLCDEVKIQSLIFSTTIRAGTLEDNGDTDAKTKIVNACFNNQFRQDLENFATEQLAVDRRQNIARAIGNGFPGPQNE